MILVRLLKPLWKWCGLSVKEVNVEIETLDHRRKAQHNLYPSYCCISLSDFQCNEKFHYWLFAFCVLCYMHIPEWVAYILLSSRKSLQWMLHPVNLCSVSGMGTRELFPGWSCTKTAEVVFLPIWEATSFRWRGTGTVSLQVTGWVWFFQLTSYSPVMSKPPIMASEPQAASLSLLFLTTGPQPFCPSTIVHPYLLNC